MALVGVLSGVLVEVNAEMLGGVNWGAGMEALAGCWYGVGSVAGCKLRCW